MIGNADSLKVNEETKFEKLRKVLKEFYYYPTTEYGTVTVKILNDKIKKVEVTVDHIENNA